VTGLPISYQWRGGAMLRASTDPGGLEPPPGLDLDAADGTVQGRAWLAQVWQRSAVRSAVEAASPSLGEQIGRIAGGAGDDRQVRRAVLSLASYLLRWQRRATPFAWFAGVAPVHIGPRAQVVWGQRHRGLTVRGCPVSQPPWSATCHCWSSWRSWPTTQLSRAGGGWSSQEYRWAVTRC